jgi:L-ascorbate metabolism protein UlaG (beta-lactamase superfamily)
MEVKYFGNSCFRIKGKDTVLLTNPFDHSLGIKLSGLTADLALFSSNKDSKKNFNLVKSALNREKPFLIDEPGEYEAGGVFVLGIPFNGKTIYIITIDGMRLGFLGEIKEKLTEKELEEIDGVDILFLPVGGNSVLSEKQALFIQEKIQPKIIIPMSFKVPSLKINFTGVEEFLKEIGAEGLNALDKLIIAKDRLPLEKEVILLNAKKN